MSARKDPLTVTASCASRSVRATIAGALARAGAFTAVLAAMGMATACTESTDDTPGDAGDSPGAVLDGSATQGRGEAAALGSHACGRFPDPPDEPPDLDGGIQVLHESEGVFTALAVNSRELFYLEAVGPICLGGGAKPGRILPPRYLYRQSGEGGARERLLAKPLSAQRIIANERYVFWDTSRFDLTTGSLTTRTDDCGEVLAVRGQDAFVSCERGIGCLPGGDGPLQIIVSTDASPWALSVHEDRVYFVDPSALSTARFGGRPATIGAGLYPNPYGPTTLLWAIAEGTYVNRLGELSLVAPDGRVAGTWRSGGLQAGSERSAYLFGDTNGALERVTGTQANAERIFPGQAKIAADEKRLFVALDGVLSARQAAPMTQSSPAGVEVLTPTRVVGYESALGPYADAAIPTAQGGVVLAAHGRMARLSASGATSWTIETMTGTPALASDAQGVYCLIASEQGLLMKVSWDGELLWDLDLPAGQFLIERDAGVTVAGGRAEAGDGGPPVITPWSCDVTASGAIVRCGDVGLAGSTRRDGGVRLIGGASSGEGFLLAGSDRAGLDTCEGGVIPENTPVSLASWVAAFDADGALVWKRTFRGGDEARVAPTDDGGAIVLLTVNGTVDVGTQVVTVPFPGLPHAILVRLDTAGRTMWVRSLPSRADLALVGTGADARIFVTGYATPWRPLVENGFVATSPFLARLSLAGDIERVVRRPESPVPMSQAFGTLALLLDREVHLFSDAELLDGG